MSMPLPAKYLVTALLLVVAGWFSLFTWSALPITAEAALDALTSPQPGSVVQTVVLDLRLPRVLIAAIVGACFAVAGAVMQGLTRNPLASPGLFGVNAGAALGVALASLFISWQSDLLLPGAAVVGGGAAWLLVMLLGAAWQPGAERGRLILAGLAISALCAALTRACMILAEEQASSVITWLTGSLASVSWDDYSRLWPLALAGLLAAMLLTPSLNLLSMGEDQARNLGLRLGRIRLLASLTALVLVAAAIATAGAIAFVGLLVPHMARAWVGPDQRKVLPLSMLLGALLVVAADTLSRGIVYPTETPAGAILALIGAPFFLYMVRART